MHLEIVSPDKKVFSGEVKLVQVPGADGSFEILKNHAPIISTLTKGRVKIVEMDDKEQFYDIEKGVVEVNKNKIVLLTERV
ncbi:MAG: ATP synthase F1 subunit epsilon [Salinivirgaceae bacterium]